MPEFRTNSNLSPRNSYKSFKFRIKIDGKYVAGVSKMSALGQPAKGLRLNLGENSGISSKLSNQNQFAIIFAQGVTVDKDFANWANKTQNSINSVARAPPANYRKDATIEVYNEAGKLAVVYRVYGCWISEYQALPDLDASANAVVIEHIKLENEGWSEDTSVTEPTEPPT